MLRNFSLGRVRVGDLLDLVVATDGTPQSVETLIRNVYDWHNRRSVAGMQLTFAPVATAILAIVAKPDATILIVLASVVAVVAILVGIHQIRILNGLQKEYAYAVRLGIELGTLRDSLGPYPHGVGAPKESIAGILYRSIGGVAMTTYRDEEKCRSYVLGVVAECGSDDRSRPGPQGDSF